MSVEAGNIYICHGYTKVVQGGSGLIFVRSPSPKDAYNPDIDHLFHSLVPFTDDITILAAILTGIGEDGVLGCKAISEKGMRCMTESEQSAIVDGMPSRARTMVPDIEVMHIEDMIENIKEFCR